jgi:hypothetical protein
MSGGTKLIVVGLLCAVVGIVWTFAWGAWGDLWNVIKGGISLFILAAALICLALGLVQVHEDRE